MSVPRVSLPLPIDEPRCSSDACPRTSQCARRLASVEIGARMQDYTMMSTPWYAAMCSGFVDLASLRALAPLLPTRQIKPYPVSG